MFGREENTNLHTVAFYNLENLFDTVNDFRTLDDDFTPEGSKHWDTKKYQKKLQKLGAAISRLGALKSGKIPAVVGLAEVENKRVLSDLTTSKYLKDKTMSFIHYDSPDERGIDTAMLYDHRQFEVLKSDVVPLLVYNAQGERDFTRDILHVTGLLNEEPMHIIINHWPSRRDGAAETAYKRVEAAKKVHEIMNKVRAEEHEPNFIIMGDFNDDPVSESVDQYLMSDELFNPMKKFYEDGFGSARYDEQWNLFDQIIFSQSFFQVKSGTHTFAHADIFDERMLAEWKGKFKGNPFRTFAGRKYLGGYSDHFPVYIHLQKH